MTNSQLDESPDLGFGAIVASESGRRLLNRDGTFNVRRHDLGPFRSLSLYHYLLNVSWPRFLGLIAVGYMLANLAFATAFLACGPGALQGGGWVFRWVRGFRGDLGWSGRARIIINRLPEIPGRT